MIKLTLTGQVPSLKNSKQLFTNKATGKMFITSSQASKEWVEDALWQLKGKPVVEKYPVAISLTFYFKGNHRKDIDNAASSVLDVLRSDPKNARQGVIDDDDFKHVNHLCIKFGGIDKINPRCEVEIYGEGL